MNNPFRLLSYANQALAADIHQHTRHCAKTVRFLVISMFVVSMCLLAIFCYLVFVQDFWTKMILEHRDGISWLSNTHGHFLVIVTCAFLTAVHALCMQSKTHHGKMVLLVSDAKM